MYFISAIFLENPKIKSKVKIVTDNTNKCIFYIYNKKI